MLAATASTVVDNFYNALTGDLLTAIGAGLVELPLGSTVALKPIRREAQIHAALRKAVDSYQRVTSETAIRRHSGNLIALGVPLPCSGLSIDSTSLAYLPVFAGLLFTLVATLLFASPVPLPIGRPASGSRPTHRLL